MSIHGHAHLRQGAPGLGPDEGRRAIFGCGPEPGPQASASPAARGNSIGR